MRACIYLFFLLLMGGGRLALLAQAEHTWEIVAGRVVGLKIDQSEHKKTELFRAGSTVNILHRTSYHNGELIIRPLIAFQADGEYALWIDGHPALEVKVPSSTETPPSVTDIYPRSGKLPANLLRMVIVFDRKMSESLPYPFIHLLDDEGDTLQRAILPLEPPLWDSSHRRLTLWLDPGRIKRELNLNRRYGSPLKAGQNYELRIDADFPDSRGNKAGKSFSKFFYTVEADRQKPQVQLVAPRMNSLDTLFVDFSEPVDIFSARGRIFLFMEGRQISHSFQESKDGQRWYVKPQQPWEKGRYELKVLATVEDFAGNKLNRLFDVDLNRDNNHEESKSESFVILPFTLE